MEATRTLVKSPPELWAEVSDVAALTRHLGEFGELRIVRAEPEAVVEWEGDLASGTRRAEPAGWGTRVTLSVEPERRRRSPGRLGRILFAHRDGRARAAGRRGRVRFADRRGRVRFAHRRGRARAADRLGRVLFAPRGGGARA